MKKRTRQTAQPQKTTFRKVISYEEIDTTLSTIAKNIESIREIKNILNEKILNEKNINKLAKCLDEVDNPRDFIEIYNATIANVYKLNKLYSDTVRDSARLILEVEAAQQRQRLIEQTAAPDSSSPNEYAEVLEEFLEFEEVKS